MPSNHIQRINDDIRRTLASLLREVKDPRVQQGDLLSIVRTETTGDLRYCTVYLSVLGDVNEKELKKGLKSCSGWLRHELGTSLSLRYTPELIFTPVAWPDFDERALAECLEEYHRRDRRFGGISE